MACLIKHDVVNTPFMCIPQGLSIMNYQELMELIIQLKKINKKLLVMLKAADLVPAVCSWTIFKSPPFKSKPTKLFNFTCNQQTLHAFRHKLVMHGS